MILAPTIPSRLVTWVEGVVEDWLGLTINRRKTRVVRLTLRGRESITFLGHTFRYERRATGGRYVAAMPSTQAVAQCRAAVRRIVHSRRSLVPIAVLIAQVNQLLRGWGQYFGFGYERRAFREVNAYVVARLTHHLQRRSQRPCRPPAGVSWYAYLTRTLGMVQL